MKSFRNLNSAFVLGNAVGLLLFCIQLGHADTVSVLSASEVPHALALRNVEMRDNVMAGEIVNHSPHRVRDVELLIRQIWHWNNEFRPGANPPGAAGYYTVMAEIPSGGSERFTYKMPSPLPVRSDGFFETVVTVAGFTEIREEMQERKNVDDWRPVS
jgi:hypothetical protein